MSYQHSFSPRHVFLAVIIMLVYGSRLTNGYVNMQRIHSRNVGPLEYVPSWGRLVRETALPQNRRPPHPTEYWEGDDRRLVSRWRRRIRHQFGSDQPVRSALVLINLLMFGYQVSTSVGMIRRRWPSYWPRDAATILWDSAWSTPLTNPVTQDFAHSIVKSRYQPHRYLTAGFLHGGLLHFLVNMDSLRKLPSWLENELGRGLYLTTFLASIVFGNIGHSAMTMGHMERVLCIGASGGICGLCGLMYASLARMGNGRAATQVAMRMLLLFIYGLLSPQVSNAAHVGGFIGGVAMGILFGPSYRKSYSARRKNSLEADPFSREYRMAMGFGYTPSDQGLLPLKLVWISAAAAILTLPALRKVPFLIIKGLAHPGSLSPWMS